MSRLVREITQTVTKEPFRWTAPALGAIHEAVEAHAVKLFEKSQMAAIHAKRVTVMPKDFHHVHRILHE
jgi:histone H3